MERSDFDRVIAAMPDGELKSALLVVAKYASEHGFDDRNSFEVSVWEDEEEAEGVIIGVYRF